MPESPVTPKHKPLSGSSPAGRASQLRKATSSQGLGLSPKSTRSTSRDEDRADPTTRNRRTLEPDHGESRNLRHRSSTSTFSRATASSFVTSTSGAGTIVGISKDVSANRTVGSGQDAQGQDSNPDQAPGRTPLAALSNMTSRNVPARNSGQEDTTPAKTQHTGMGPARMYLSPRASGGGPTAGAHAPTRTVLPQLRKLQRQIQTLTAENDGLRAVKAAQLAAIDDLRGQLRTRDAEHARLAGRMRAEADAREDEAARLREAAAALKEEKWALLGRVAELELGQTQLAVAGGGQASGGAAGDAYAGSVCSGAQTPPSCIGSEAGGRSIAGYDTPGSLYSGQGEGGRARSPCHSASSSVVTASARSFVRRRPSAAASDSTAASLAEEELDILSDQLVAHHEQHGKERQAMAERLSALEGDLAATRRQRDKAEWRNRDLEARLAAQVAIVRRRSSMALPPAPTLPPPPIPDLPVLTYAKVGFVWFDTVMSTFKYWGLSQFISQPDETLFAGTDPDREARRLRAVVLLKRAIDDDILDDIMYLQSQKCISEPTSLSAAGSQSQGMPPEIASPYFLFHTAAILKRTVPSSLTDFGWLDRIRDADFEGIEGFTSLVNILNRRHSQLYGTSADHYDALIPKIQENMSRRFPDLEKSLMDPCSVPKKWWHLALWMSKMVKRRQGRIAGIDEP